MSRPARLVVTALTGQYEALTEQPAARASGLSFLCLTDDPELASDTWEIRQIEPLIPHDPVRSAREVKLRLHRYLPETAEVLWIDNSVLLTGSPDELLDEWLDQADVAIPQHSFRGPVLEEFAEVAALGLDDLSRIYEQFAHYRAAHHEAIADRTLWTGMMARRLGVPAVRAFGECWMEQVLRYSRRDQLSVNVALRRTAPRFSSPTLDNRHSPWHTWPAAKQRREEARARVWDFIPESLAAARAEGDRRKAAAEVAGLQAEVAGLQAQLDDLLQQRADLVRQVERGSQRSAALEAQLAKLEEDSRDLAAVLASRSFRLTSAPRRFAAAARSAGRRGTE